MDLIFDIGNVILDWNINNILEEIKASPEQSKQLAKYIFGHQNWLKLDCGDITEKEFSSKATELSGLNSEFISKAFLIAKESLKPIPRSIKLLQDLHAADFSLYCLSNMSAETYSHIKDADFFKLFSGIVISGNENCMKPNEDIFKLTLHRYNLKPSNTLFIDDHIDNINTAIKLGISTHHFKRSNKCYSALEALIHE